MPLLETDLLNNGASGEGGDGFSSSSSAFRFLLPVVVAAADASRVEDEAPIAAVASELELERRGIRNGEETLSLEALVDGMMRERDSIACVLNGDGVVANALRPNGALRKRRSGRG